MVTVPRFEDMADRVVPKGYHDILGVALVITAGVFSGLSHLMRPIGETNDSVALLFGTAVPLLLSVLLVVGGLWLRWRGYDGLKLRVGMWCLIGVAILIGVSLVTVRYQAAYDIELRNTGTIIGATATVGGVLGLLIGMYDAERVKNERRMAGEREKAERLSQRLTVLNRVLRHDIRNDVNVIYGNADQLTDDTDAGAEPATQAPEVTLHPRGPAFGQAFHDLMEARALGAWPAPGEPLPDNLATAIAQALRRHGVAETDRDGTAGPIQRTDALIRATVHTPLPDIGPLAALPPPRTATELEFFLRLRGARGRSLLAAVAAAGYGTRSGVDATVLNGLMHGYIDLVVEQGGRYWIIDYKTDVVGPRFDDYAPHALAEAVRAHHYDLQYLIYSLALHRHLRARLPGYDPARHLGGVQYLFVRGLQPDDPTRGVHRDQPPVALIEQLDALLDTAEVTP